MGKLVSKIPQSPPGSPSRAFRISTFAMARSITFQGSFGGDPLGNLERSRAEASGRKPSKRELLEMGNRPLSDSGRRTPDDAAHKTLEVFLADEAAPKQRSEAWKKLEALFSKA